MVTVKIKKIKEVSTPSYAHEGDAGVDLHSAEEYSLNPMERILVSTGIMMAIPKGYEGQVRPKSGLAINHGLGFVNSVGTIDSGYRGEIKIPCINFSDGVIKIEKGNKIGQMVFNKVEEVSFEEVEELDETSRNQGGFGSTGLK